MSFLDDIGEGLGGLVSGIGDFLSSGSLGSNLAKTALMGFAVNKLNSDINRENTPTPASQTPAPDPGVRLQVRPDPSHKIPVVYGTAYLGGIITDAELADSNKTLYTVFTFCEQTGSKISDTLASVISFGYIRVNDQRAVFKANGYTIDYTVDRDGNVDRSLSGLMDIRCYSGSSAAVDNVSPQGATLASTQAAWDMIPSWTSSYTMDDLIFIVVKMTYSKEKNLTAIPEFTVQIKNNMTMPGDVLYDYMTNTRYGAGIPAAEINSA